jgi:hypothetical protein
MEIIPNVFSGRGKPGDFNWMIGQSKYDDILFIFNDNEEYHDTNRRGAGNAIIRQYNKYNKELDIPRSAGIPTGTLARGGYKKLDNENKKIIKNSIKEIKELIVKYDYKKICYSADEDGLLATAIFYVDPKVLKYITKRICRLTKLVTEN